MHWENWLLSFWKCLFKQVKSNILAIFDKQHFCVYSKHEFYPFFLNKQWRIWHLSRKFDLFLNFFFEIKNSPNEPGRQFLCWENLLESYVQYVEQVDTNQVSSSYSCYSKLKFHFLMLKNKNVHLLYVLLNTECFI